MAQETTFYRVTPLFQNNKGEVIAGNQTYLIHTDPKDLLVVSVPADSVTLELARKKEQEMMTLTKKDVIVTSDNVKWLAVEELTPQEAAQQFPKGVPRVREAQADPKKD